MQRYTNLLGISYAEKLFLHHTNGIYTQDMSCFRFIKAQLYEI